MHRTFTLICCVILAATLAGCYGFRDTTPSGDVSYRQSLIDKAAVTVRSMRASREASSIGYFLKHARGVLIFPGIVKAGFIYGAEGGNGVLVAKDAGGHWSAPAFYTLAGGSFGLQVGVQEASVVLVFMNDRALEGAVKSGLKLGADVSLAAASEGAKGEASTITAFKDVYYFADVGGLFAGVSLDGSVIKVRGSLNEKYYGYGATPEAIVLERRFDHPGALLLKNALSAAAR